MGCFFVLLILISPRLALFFLWIATDFVDRAFEGFLVPFLGLLLFPITTLTYVLAYQPVVGVSGFGWVLVAIAFLLDLSSFGGASRYRRA
jgi:hypothetical protein